MLPSSLPPSLPSFIHKHILSTSKPCAGLRRSAPPQAPVRSSSPISRGQHLSHSSGTQSITLPTSTEGPCHPSTDLPLLILTCVGRVSSGPFWSVPNSHQPPQTLAKLCFYSFPVQNEAVPSVDFIYRGCQDSRKAGLERNKMWRITYSLPVLFYTLSKSVHKMKPDIFSCY